MNAHTIAAWMLDHPEFCITIGLALIYFARSIMPRVPNPAWPPWLLDMWKLEQRILMMPWDRWLGGLSLPGRIDPPWREVE